MDRIELVESLYAISTNKLIEGSLYRVFDCCPQPVDQFECIKKMGGICRKDDYSTAQGKCEPNQCTPFTNVCIEIYHLLLNFCNLCVNEL